ncbi:MAG: SAM-dependent methyltransferase, partial [Terracidiphilus sp.]
MKETKDSARQNVASVRNHYNLLFRLLDRETTYLSSGWNQRPPIVNLGYWSSGVTEARDAQVNFVRQLASRLPELKGRRVLDVGCGLCGPAAILAADYGA